MTRKYGFFLFLLLVSFFSAQALLAHEKVTVIPLMGKTNSFKGDLYYTIPFAQFEAAAETVDYLHPSFFFVPYGYLTLQSGIAPFTAPVNLPDNAVITEISLSATDNGGSNNILLYFRKDSLTTSDKEYIPDNTPLNTDVIAIDTTDIISHTVDNEIVDNQNYYYFVSATFSGAPSDQLKAVRIKYRLP